ncbi:MAG: chromate efflux transporter [Acidimicrobiales bacterium]
MALSTIALAFGQIGLTAYGMAVMAKLKSTVLGRRWLTAEQMNEGLALVQIYPGPIMIDFTAYVGYRLRGVRGAIAATLGFVTPSFILMVALSALYFAGASLGWVREMVLGLDAIVVGVVMHVTLDFAKQYLASTSAAAVAILAFTADIYGVSPVLVIVGALMAGALWMAPRAPAVDPTRSPSRSDPTRSPSRAPEQAGQAGQARRWLAIGALASVVIATAIVLVLAEPRRLATMGTGLLEIGAVAFGNGLTILPLITNLAVVSHHWLTPGELSAGIAFGQVTPGPFLITAAFIGYKLAGVPGAALATFAIFSPSFAMTLGFTEVSGPLQRWRPVRGALAGVMAAFVGLLSAIILQLGHPVIASRAAMALAGAALVAARAFKLDMIWVFAGGLAIWAAAWQLGLLGH